MKKIQTEKQEDLLPQPEERKRRIKWAVSSAVCVASATGTFLMFLVLWLVFQINLLGQTEPEMRPSNMTPLLNKPWIVLIFLLGLLIVSFAVSLVETGARDETGKVRYNWFDRVFPEIQIASALAVLYLLYYSESLFFIWLSRYRWVKKLIDAMAETKRASKMMQSYTKSWFDDYNQPRWIMLFFSIVIAVAVFAFVLVVFQSIVKRLKNQEFIRRTLSYQIAKIIVRGFGGVSRSLRASAFFTWLGVLVLCWICSVNSNMLLLAAIIAAIPIIRFFRRFGQVRRGIEEIQKGNTEYRIRMSGEDELKQMADALDEISISEKKSLEKELRGQHLRNSLIANVSHDLKTPLTSMVSYIDLLKIEGLESDNAPKYLEILDQKTRRLQKLTEDLFEASKASSGDMPVNMETIDLVSLVRQSIGELSEKLEENDIQAVMSESKQHILVRADGLLLWRVIENLLVNVSKYAVPHSRVYIELEDGEKEARLRFKNVSKESLNITADELLSRFTRGDASRATEGSGLGLTIAKDLTALIGGRLNLTIDGDLFKTEICLRKPDASEAPASVPAGTNKSGTEQSGQ